MERGLRKAAKSVRPQGVRRLALFRRTVLALALLGPGCATSGFTTNALVAHGEPISVPLRNGEVQRAMADLTREISHLLLQEFGRPTGAFVSDPEAGAIEMTLLVPAADGPSRTLHLYIRLQVRDANDESATMVPRIFAEMVNQKGSVQWMLEGPDHDLASLVHEIESYISSRAGV